MAGCSIGAEVAEVRSFNIALNKMLYMRKASPYIYTCRIVLIRYNMHCVL